MRADKAKVLRLLKTASGQIEGVVKMIEEDRYCLDISNQVMAAESVLKRANREIIKAHMSGCVREAKTDAERDEKIEEILKLLEKLM
ncbi:MAG: metal-sensing transcriptional repressor [Clostridiaceae bacterium]|nr:metal-sensing transcriptional repressor [Clostridiaceae bacterium]